MKKDTCFISLGHLPPHLPFPGYRGQAWKPGPQHTLSGFSRVLVGDMDYTTSTRIKSCAAAAADLQHPLEEFKVKSRNEALCALGKLAAQVFSLLDILRS